MADAPLVVMALQIEEQGAFERAGVEVLFTGLGKVNAAYSLTRRLVEQRRQGRRPLVVNFGTAGSRIHPTGTIVACRHFVQRDIDLTGLGFQRGETPFEEVPPELVFDPVFTGLPEGRCGTGDSFETQHAGAVCDVVDMEAYALAKVCWLEGLPFACAKFITDGADASAAGDWQANLPRAARGFLELYGSLVRPPAGAAPKL